MLVDGKQIRPIWYDSDDNHVKIIDQRKLPHDFVIFNLNTFQDAITAIKEMYVRGAPLIGITGAYGTYLAFNQAINQSNTEEFFTNACEKLKAARPTAVNLFWGVDRVMNRLKGIESNEKKQQAALTEAADIAEEEAQNCKNIGEYGLSLIKKISQKKNGEPVNVLTHCNAGWLACIEYGTATAPMYTAHDNGIDIHVWVDETRPLNQGARLTAWELGKHGIKHTIIPDNTGGHLMQHSMVDIVIVGTDRTTYAGDVANKIGTYLKALAAKDNDIPFYVALPSSTFDWNIKNGLSIPIEERNPDEVRFIEGRYNQETITVLLTPESSPAANYAFDVTPSRLVTGFITERGICKPTEEGIKALFPRG